MRPFSQVAVCLFITSSTSSPVRGCVLDSSFTLPSGAHDGIAFGTIAVIHADTNCYVVLLPVP